MCGGFSAVLGKASGRGKERAQDLALVIAQTVNFDVDEIRPRRLGLWQGRGGEYQHGSNEGKHSEDFRHIQLTFRFCRDNITQLRARGLKNVSAPSLMTIE
jgi:hypothetical protein